MSQNAEEAVNYPSGVLHRKACELACISVNNMLSSYMSGGVLVQQKEGLLVAMVLA